MIMQSEATETMMREVSGMAMLIGLVVLVILGICAIGLYFAHRRTDAGFMTEDDYMAELLGRPDALSETEDSDTIVRKLGGQPAE